MIQGAKAEENFAQIRDRIKTVFNQSASPGKVTTVARTETAHQKVH